VAARALMGLGAAFIMPSTLSIIKDVLPPEEQSRAIGIWGGMAALGIPLGPVLGGLLLDDFWWGSVFLVNAPLVVVALVIGAKLIPESRALGERVLDIGGALLSTATFGTLIYGLIEAPRNGWTDPVTLGWLAAAVVLGAAFVVWESRTAHPMLPMSLLRKRAVAAPVLTIVLMVFGMFGAMFVLTQYLQMVIGLSPCRPG
jgi:MFS family permease